MPREVAIPYAAAGIVVALGLLTMLAWRAADHRARRRRASRTAALLAGVADERRAGWFFEDRHPANEDEPEPQLIDPPVVPSYLPLDTVSSMDPAALPRLAPPPPRMATARPTGHADDACDVPDSVAPVDEARLADTGKWVTVGSHRVHQDCLHARRDGAPPCDGCRPWLSGPAPDLPHYRDQL